jgi:hypothetical protein
MRYLEPDDLLVELRAIRRALNLGLANFAEIERLRDAKEVHEQAGQVVPADMRPTDFLGDGSGAAKFAEALIAVQILEDDALDRSNGNLAAEQGTTKAQHATNAHEGTKAH